MGKMKCADLALGGESRACTGKYISLLATYKATSILSLEFDNGVVDEAAEWSKDNRRLFDRKILAAGQDENHSNSDCL